MNLNDVIIRPHITEKTETIKQLGKTGERYTLRVHPDANKELVKQALYKLYKVKVVDLKVINVRGKLKRFRQAKIQLPSWKKIIVVLASGQKIDFAKGV
ncbi:MAG: 50S ribosomal protein L23 [Leptospirales bacterium]|nr:50S ribosomal protein L23 [Leptospirales bacterium]